MSTTVAERSRTTGAGARIAAAVAALVFGLVAAKLAARAVPLHPDVAAATAVAYPSAVVDTRPDIYDSGGEAGWSQFLSARDDVKVPWLVAPRAQPSGAAESQWRADARQRFAAAGWTIGDGIPDSVAFFATKGDTRAAVYGTVMDPQGFDTYMDVGTVQPWWVSLIALCFGIGGALLGRLAALRVARLAARRSNAGRAGVRELAVIGFVLLLPVTVQTALLLAADASRADQPWLPSSTLLEMGRWPGALGVLLLLIAVALATDTLGRLTRPR